MRIAAAAGALGLAAVVAGSVVAPAAAAPPVRGSVVPGVYEFSGVCAFPIVYDETANKGRLTFFSDGHMTSAGSYKVRITNKDDPSRSMDVNATGPQWFWPDGSNKLGGRTLFIMTAGIDVTGGLYLGTGTWSITRNDLGGIATISGSGNLGSDLCALIA